MLLQLVLKICRLSFNSHVYWHTLFIIQNLNVLLPGELLLLCPILLESRPVDGKLASKQGSLMLDFNPNRFPKLNFLTINK